MKFKVTYWPGTAQMSNESVKALKDTGGLDKIAKVGYIEAPSLDQANRISAMRYAGTSDGVLIEPAE